MDIQIKGSNISLNKLKKLSIVKTKRNFKHKLLVASAISSIITVSSVGYFITNNVSYIPKSKLIGTWELQSITRADTLVKDDISNVNKTLLQNLFGKYIVFNKDGTYYNSANGIDLNWQYGNGFVSVNKVDGNEVIFSTAIEGGILGRNLKILDNGYYYSYTKSKEDFDEEPEDFTNKIVEKYYGEPLDMNSILSKENILKKYNLLSNVGQESILVFYTDNSYAYTCGTIVEDYVTEDDNEEKENTRSTYIDNVSSYQGNFVFDTTGVYLFTDNSQYDKLYTSKEYMYSTPLDGLVLYKEREVNALETSGYLLEADVTNNLNGIHYKFFVDGNAKVTMTNGEEIDYTYTVNSDGLIEMLPRSAIGTSGIPDYLFYETGTNIIYRNVYEQNSWNNYWE